MERGQRIALVAVAAVIAVVAVLVLRTGDEDGDGPAPAADTTTAPVASAPKPKPKPKPKPPLLTANSGKTVRVKKGETARFRVRAKSADEVHVHGYDVLRPLPANRTIAVRFPAKLEGIYEIELEGSHTPLGELEVRP
jgi:FtsP/CotA-like multicopper oxidase with cupredoxin domain